MKANQKQNNINLGWQKVKLGDVAKYSADRMDATKLTSNNYVGVNNILFAGGIIPSSHVPASGRVSGYKIGDTLLSNIRPYLKKYWFAENEGGCSADVLAIRANANVILSTFLYVSLSRNEFFDYEMAGSKGVKMPRGDKTQIMQYELHLPPLPEQSRIVTILETWDSVIEKLNQKIAIKKEIKKGLMQKLLTGKKRLPGFSDGWKERKLGEISDITTGSSNREDSGLDGKFTFFDRSEDIRTSNIYIFDGEAVIVAGEGQKFIPKYFVGKFDLHQRTYAIMNFKETDSKYIYYYLYQNKNYLLAQAVGSTVKSLRLPMFTKMNIIIPEYKEQKAIAQILTTADQEITTLQKKLSYWQDQKKYLLNNLITGKIRTPENLLELTTK